MISSATIREEDKDMASTPVPGIQENTSNQMVLYGYKQSTNNIFMSFNSQRRKKHSLDYFDAIVG